LGDGVWGGKRYLGNMAGGVGEHRRDGAPLERRFHSQGASVFNPPTGKKAGGHKRGKSKQKLSNRKMFQVNLFRPAHKGSG